MNLLTSPEVLLSLAKVTALLLVILAIAPLLKNPTHRARLWTFTILVLPLLFLTSFTTPLLKLIPNKTYSQPIPTISNSENPNLDFTSVEAAPSEAFIAPTPENPPTLTYDETLTAPESLIEAPTTLASAEPLPTTPFPWVLIILISGVIISLIPFLVTSLKLLRLTQSTALDPPRSLWEKIHQTARRTPLLFFTPSPAAPFTYGIIRPRVLLPDDSPTWPLRRLQSTLLHEAAHLRRRDPLVRFLTTLVRAVFWFHPLIWIANRQLISAQEQACDQAALTNGISPDDYAEDLLACAAHSHLTPSAALSMAKWSQLGNRIRHILEKPKPSNMTTIALTTALALITTLAVTSIGFSQNSSNFGALEPETPKDENQIIEFPCKAKNAKEARKLAKTIDLPALVHANSLIILSSKSGIEPITINAPEKLKAFRDALKVKITPPSAGKRAFTLQWKMNEVMIWENWIYSDGEWGFIRPGTNYTTGQNLALIELANQALADHLETKNKRGALLDRKNKPLAIDKDGERTYPFGKSTPHLIGFLGRKSINKADGFIGKSGLEKAYDASLLKKNNIKLTLDAALQKHCYETLEAQQHPGVIVVQDPNTGEILSMVSYPSYDPNLFIPAITRENFDRLNQDKKHPLLNRATSPFVPGSVVKPLVALAGEYAGLDNPEIHCKGFMAFGREGKLKLRDWKRNRDERMKIPRALQTSCNTYFMELGIRADQGPLIKMGDLFHLNESLLSSLPSSKGLWMTLPKGQNFTRAHIALSTLGQGDTLLSPLHINAITSAIATGSWHQPHLVSGQKTTKPSVPLIGQGQITADSLEHIREGLNLAINAKGGTATRAAIEEIQVAGKTATAQRGGNPDITHNSWFTGYAPYKKPEYSITVMLEGPNSGGKFAAPIASEIFKFLLGKN